MRRIGCSTLIFLSFLAPALASAVPAPPFEIPLRDADGKTVSARMFGDEHLSWFEDSEGYALAFDPDSGTWRYAVLRADGRLAPSAHRAVRADAARLGLEKHLRPAPRVVAEARRSRDSSRSLWKASDPRGEVTNLVLLVQFANQKGHFQPADFDPVFNGPANSVRAYYDEVSRGQTKMTSTIVGWIPLPHDDTYYAYNDQTSGYPQDMLKHAVAYLDSQGFDFTRFDKNGDGFVDAVDIIHSGPSYETTGDRRYIHSHFLDMRQIRGPLVTHDGIKLSAYHTEAEFGANNADITQIGVICHETGHFFGLPDLYDYGYDSGGLGTWSLMSGGAWAGPGNNGTKPTHPDGWSRYMLGFATPRRLEAPEPGVRLRPVAQSGELLRIDRDLPDGQYFLLEVRARQGFDAYLPGSGLLVYHVDENQMTNDDQNHYLVDIEQADGRRDLNRSAYQRGDNTDAFPISTNKAFTPSSKPGSVPYGGGFSGIYVENIARDGADVRFDVKLVDPLALGAACERAGQCGSGFCIGGLCCNSACDGACEACAKALGAAQDGVCSPLDAVPCNDRDGCTRDDTCHAGVCKGTLITCGGDACSEPAVCDRRVGACVPAPKPDGLACDDGDLCSRKDVCKAGRCVGEDRVACEDPGECAIGSCDPATGKCAEAWLPENTACSEGTCSSGECGGKCGCSSASGALPLAGLLGLALLKRARRRSSRG